MSAYFHFTLSLGFIFLFFRSQTPNRSCSTFDQTPFDSTWPSPSTTILILQIFNKNVNFTKSISIKFIQKVNQVSI